MTGLPAAGSSTPAFRALQAHAMARSWRGEHVEAEAEDRSHSKTRKPQKSGVTSNSSFCSARSAFQPPRGRPGSQVLPRPACSEELPCQDLVGKFSRGSAMVQVRICKADPRSLGSEPIQLNDLGVDVGPVYGSLEASACPNLADSDGSRLAAHGEP